MYYLREKSNKYRPDLGKDLSLQLGEQMHDLNYMYPVIPNEPLLLLCSDFHRHILKMIIKNKILAKRKKCALKDIY